MVLADNDFVVSGVVLPGGISVLCFISDSRESLPIAHLLQQEGVKVDYYIHDATYRSNFGGIMPNIGLWELGRILRDPKVQVFFDITLPNRKHANDLTLFHKFRLPPGSLGVFGTLADRLRKNHKVIGSSSFTERIELDREAGFDLARKIGFAIPKYKKYKGLKDGIKFLQGPGKGQRWVFKLLNNGPLDLTYPETFDGELLDLMQTTIPVRLEKEKLSPEKAVYILQEFVEGVECSNELWFDGREFKNPNRTIEDKKLASGNTGPATGSQSNVVAMCQDMKGPAFKEMQRLLPWMLKCGYRGPIDANIIFHPSGKAYFLEWTPRTGWSAFYCLCAFIPPGQLSSFILNNFEAVFLPGYVASQLISLYPYPNLDKKQLEMNVKGNLVNHRLQDLQDVWLQDVMLDKDYKLRIAGSDGIVGVLTKRGATVEEAINKVHDRLEGKNGAKKIEVSGNLQYRTRHDHMTRATERVNKLRKMGIEF